MIWIFVFFLLIYWLVPFKKLWLLFGSLAFYWYVAGEQILILFAVGVINYVFSKRKIPLVIFDVLVLVFFKLTSLPLGMSFYIFQCIGYVIDSKKSTFLDFSLLIAYFPKIISGPLEKSGFLKIRKPDFGETFFLISTGLFKKFVIANSLGSLVDSMLGTQSNSLILVYAYAFQIFYDFSGYTDLARGISSLFGIRLSRNFDMPLVSSTPYEFFKRWHMTLSKWIREYVYDPLFFRFQKISHPHRLYIAWFFASLLAMTVFGLWHGFTLSHLMIGLWLFLWITIFRLSGLKSRIATFHIVCFALVLFRLNMIQWLSLFKYLHVFDFAVTNLYLIPVAASFMFVENFVRKNRNPYLNIAYTFIMLGAFVAIGVVPGLEFIYGLY